jgi:mannose-6-phosphate isomerase-like protein (cupin superfamily)
MRSWIIVGVGLLAGSAAACHGERTSSVAGPALTVAPEDGSSSTLPLPPPPSGAFQEITARGTQLPVASCREVLVTPISGGASVGAERLAPGDVLAIRGEPDSSARTLTGQGLALVVVAQDVGCVTRARVVREGQAPELPFMGGTMHAHLDVDDPDVASFYLGRLSGTSGVAPHAHDRSWEVLCAIDAAGVFTLDGNDARLGPRTCISVPPGAKHSWKPDPGSNLNAVQMYFPPGPEQRFKKLAAEDRADHDR